MFDIEQNPTLQGVIYKLEDVVDKFKEGLNFLAVFGSVAKGTHTNGSDVDILYDYDDMSTLVEFYDYVEAKFPDTKVDLVPILEVLRESQDIIFDYFVEGSVKVHESERIYNNIQNERALARYKRVFGR